MCINVKVVEIYRGTFFFAECHKSDFIGNLNFQISLRFNNYLSLGLDSDWTALTSNNLDPAVCL